MRLTLIMAAALLLFAACSGDEPASPQGTLAPTATADRPAATPAASATATTGSDEPPATVARSGAASAAMGLGSYCWSSGGTGLCADSFGIITGPVDLEVGRGETVTIGGPLAQTEFALADARIRPVEGEPAERRDDWLGWTPASDQWSGEWSELEIEAVDGGLRFVAELPPGRYLVSLFFRFPQGDASYGLILAVR